MLQLEEAQARILAEVPVLSTEDVSLHSVASRILAADIPAKVDLPGFDNSAMDGYALLAEDITAWKPESPVQLRIIGEVPAGEKFPRHVSRGTCVRIFTGSPMPDGADAVVMQEDTRREGDLLWVLDAVKPWENMRLRGEDVKIGEVIAQAGDTLTAARVAILAATGMQTVTVTRQPVVGVLSTGSELCEPGAPLAAGKIYESNQAALAVLIKQAGGLPLSYSLVRDTAEATREALQRAFAECDCVVTTGGVSVGEHDLVKAAFEGLGGALDFWKVAIRPGKPFVFGRWRERFLFGLPGNPVSAFVTFLLLARTAILKMQGARTPLLPTVPGVLGTAIHNRGERRHFVRVRMDRDGTVHSTGTQASHLLKSLASANGLLDVPPATVFDAGRAVQVLRWDLN